MSCQRCFRALLIAAVLLVSGCPEPEEVRPIEPPDRSDNPSAAPPGLKRNPGLPQPERPPGREE